MSAHIADQAAPRPKPHHYMNADGFCHAGDMFEQGTPPIALYSAEELVRIVNAEKAEAWDQGHRLTAPHSDRCEPTCANPYREAKP